MKEKVFYDKLTVSKGPEDGMSFTITSTPVLIGRDPACLVNLQFDVTLQPEHARISLGRGGYRVRRVTAAPVYVDGARAGHIRSRRLDNGKVLRVGYTDLVLSCAEGGHAATGAPSWNESDAAWAFRAIFGSLRRLAGAAFIALKYVLRFMREHWVWSLVLLAVLAYVAIAPLRDFVNAWFNRIRDEF
jgi:hypothetical protein